MAWVEAASSVLEYSCPEHDTGPYRGAAAVEPQREVAEGERVAQLVAILTSEVYAYAAYGPLAHCPAVGTVGQHESYVGPLTVADRVGQIGGISRLVVIVTMGAQ